MKGLATRVLLIAPRWGSWSHVRGPRVRPSWASSMETLSTCLAGLALLGAMAVMMAAEPASTPEDSAVPSAVRGAPDSPSSALTGREWLVAAYGGVPYTYDSDVRIMNIGKHDFTVRDVEWQGQPFTNPIYYGVRIARWLGHGRMGSMLDFTHSKAISRRDQEARFEGTLAGKPAPEKALIGDIFNKLEASHGHNMLTLNGLLRLPSFSLRVSPYVGIGAGVSLPHSEVHVKGDPARTYEYQMAGPVAQALFGIELRLARMSYFLEYKFTFADYRMPLSERDGYVLPTDLWAQFQRWWRGTEPPGGWAETQFTSHQVIGGLGVRLPAAP